MTNRQTLFKKVLMVIQTNILSKNGSAKTVALTTMRKLIVVAFANARGILVRRLLSI